MLRISDPLLLLICGHVILYASEPGYDIDHLVQVLLQVSPNWPKCSLPTPSCLESAKNSNQLTQLPMSHVPAFRICRERPIRLPFVNVCVLCTYVWFEHDHEIIADVWTTFLYWSLHAVYVLEWVEWRRNVLPEPPPPPPPTQDHPLSNAINISNNVHVTCISRGCNYT